MIKRLLLFCAIFLLPYYLMSQVKVTEKKVEDILIQLEDAEVDIIKVQTLPKWKALELSHEMKPQMDYNVIKVKYTSNGSRKTVIIDQNLVPIRYDYLDTME